MFKKENASLSERNKVTFTFRVKQLESGKSNSVNDLDYSFTIPAVNDDGSERDLSVVFDKLVSTIKSFLISDRADFNEVLKKSEADLRNRWINSHLPTFNKKRDELYEEEVLLMSKSKSNFPLFSTYINKDGIYLDSLTFARGNIIRLRGIDYRVTLSITFPHTTREGKGALLNRIFKTVDINLGYIDISYALDVSECYVNKVLPLAMTEETHLFIQPKQKETTMTDQTKFDKTPSNEEQSFIDNIPTQDEVNEMIKNKINDSIRKGQEQSLLRQKAAQDDFFATLHCFESLLRLQGYDLNSEEGREAILIAPFANIYFEARRIANDDMSYGILVTKTDHIISVTRLLKDAYDKEKDNQHHNRFAGGKRIARGGLSPNRTIVDQAQFLPKMNRASVDLPEINLNGDVINQLEGEINASLELIDEKFKNAYLVREENFSLFEEVFLYSILIKKYLYENACLESGRSLLNVKTLTLIEEDVRTLLQVFDLDDRENCINALKNLNFKLLFTYQEKEKSEVLPLLAELEKVTSSLKEKLS